MTTRFFADAAVKSSGTFVRGVERPVGSELLGEIQPPAAQVGRDDPAAFGFGQLDVEETGHAGAHHQDRLARLDPREILGPDHAGQGLDERALIVGHMVRKQISSLFDQRLRDKNVFGKAARQPLLHIRTDGIVPAPGNSRSSSRELWERRKPCLRA